MMVKLIASDIDGTLLRGGAREIDEAVFEAIRALKARGILFCAASGRQYGSLRRLFAPVADEILYVCENGSIVFHHDAVLAKTPLQRSDALQLIAQIYAQPHCEVLISGARTSYLMPKQEAFRYHMEVEVGNTVQVIASPQDISEDILKVSAFCDEDGNSAARYEQMLGPVWNAHLNVAVAGRQWLDFTLAHKGTALAQIGAALDISPRSMAVFGDNFNDIPMFTMAGASYAMAGAAPAVQAAAGQVCDDVLCVLRSMM